MVAALHEQMWQGWMSYLRESPAIENRQVQNFVELIQVGLQGTAPTDHTLADAKCPSNLAIHQLLCQPACTPIHTDTGRNTDSQVYRLTMYRCK